MRDACFRHASLPFLRALALRRSLPAAGLCLFACLQAAPASAQSPRPFLGWRTTETEHFVFHYPEHYRAWTVSLAERMESVREQVRKVVGFAPARRVHIVVDDPANDANGTAFTSLDAPTIVLWPTPPDPREEIGNYAIWNELVATHEFTHVAHLTRPSRNRLQNLLWSLSPVPLGPIAVNAPRWVLEGYATYVEGRITGSGRPNNAWRAAILRQFALEGRLPGYAQMSATGGWETGSFAYLSGSAFLEWLSRREGDSSVTALWRRMTAKTDRSFDEAFIGVYGGAPAQLYGRFVAELTADALTFERTLARDAFVTGTLVQKLQRNTGDPAVSPDGRFVALVLRRQDRPSELVVWRTANEPDTLAERRRKQQLERDPEDVPDRSFYPAPKRIVISLVAADGAPYETPRWLSDNRRLLLTRRMPMSDGTIRPDLFLWSAEDGSLSRLTSGAGIRDADPSHDGSWAAAVRCDQGWCDLVRVDLATGAVRVLLTGSVTRNYYRPRVSKRTGEIVVAEQSGDRWRIARVNPATSELRYADPDDGVTRYDATYDVDGRTIIATSEAGGIPNVERLDSARTSPTRLSAVTGAAVGADVAPDGAIWFLSLTASGYDLRRLTPDSTSIARAARLPLPMRSLFVDSLSPVLPPLRTMAVDSARRPARGAVGPERAYEFGPSRFRYLPGISSGFGGTSAQLALVRSDPVGRLGIALIGSAGSGALPAGCALEIASRRARNVLVANAWASHEAPSRILPENFSDGFDLTRFGGALRLERATATDGGDILATIGALGERQLPSALSYITRSAAFASVNVVRRQSDEDTRYVEQLYSMGEVGKSGDGNYQRQRTTLFFGVGTAGRPLTTARVSYGTMGGSDSLSRERFAIGGIPSPLIEPMLDGRRVDAAAYPVGSALGTSFSAYRLGLPLPPVELFYSAVSPDLFKRVLRSYGAEMRQHLAAVPALGTPDIDLLTGFARAVDAPVKGEWRYYVTVAVKP